MGMPASTDIANRWLRQNVTKGAANTRFIEDTFRQSSLSQQVSDEQILLDVANQIRILKVRILPVTADATPYDVYESYRSKEEKVSAYAVGVKVEDFVAAVPEPTDSDLGFALRGGEESPARPGPAPIRGSWSRTR